MRWSSVYASSLDRVVSPCKGLVTFGHLVKTHEKNLTCLTITRTADKHVV